MFAYSGRALPERGQRTRIGGDAQPRQIGELGRADGVSAGQRMLRSEREDAVLADQGDRGKAGQRQRAEDEGHVDACRGESRRRIAEVVLDGPDVDAGISALDPGSSSIDPGKQPPDAGVS